MAEEYLIQPDNTGINVNAFFEHHYERTAGHFQPNRIEDIKAPVTYAAQYLFDAISPLLVTAVLQQDGIDIGLPSGWRAKSLDLGRVWTKFIDFVNPDDADAGFIMACDLRIEEVRDRDLPIEELVKRIRVSQGERESLAKSNASSDLFRPENSSEIAQFRLYRYESDPGDLEVLTRRELQRCLLRDDDLEAVIRYRVPSRLAVPSDIVLLTSSDKVMEPGAALSALPVIAEFASKFDGFADLMQRHSEIGYVGMDSRYQSLLVAARGTFSHTASFPGSNFAAMIEEMWKRSVAIDVASRMDYITTLTDALLEDGYTSAENDYDCDDGDNRLYARDDGGVPCLYVENAEEAEDEGILVSFRDGRVIVANSDYATPGLRKSTIIDMMVDEKRVEEVTDICGYDDRLAVVIRQALTNIDCAHAALFPDAADDLKPAAPEGP
ncbi:hypothetical protein [Rhizobium sp. BK176]|uniref:hypothetical protein n=1 Tax=Rhizobium sp. BK176 TaxID=2587071 RepID=UPI00216A3C0B|nr:hypothetical protein [Rhizobium sp. BK176]MCS4089370.1 hypothetical protein [Rhizobium sp. BK176]